MTFTEYWSNQSPDQKRDFATVTGKNLDYLHRLARAPQLITAEVAMLLSKHSKGKIKPSQCRPDLPWDFAK